MQFHEHGYAPGDPRVRPATGVGLDPWQDLPDRVDVLIVGAGPTGLITAAQLSQFPGVVTRLIDRRSGPLVTGQADGVQSRTVETFQAFGFANRIIEEAYTISAMAFWRPDPNDPSQIKRAALLPDDPTGLSEFPHIVVNQARVQDYFIEFMARAPARTKPVYGVEFLGLSLSQDDYPVDVRVRCTSHSGEPQERTIRAKYAVGCDGARSNVRREIGRELVGDEAMHAWGVMDVLADSTFPDIRLKSAIQSRDGGNLLHIPREGGHLFRLYVDLGEVTSEQPRALRNVTVDEIVARANQILHPYSVQVKSVVWHSVYEVAQRLTQKFDDVEPVDVGERTPRVFIAGDACHTHSAKAAQGMNVSMQDGFNLGWKLGHVVDGRSPDSLLDTYSAERQVIAQNLIDFDKQWSSLMAAKPGQLESPSAVEDYFLQSFEFTTGFMTQYQPSLITAEARHQHLAPGFPIGKRFKSSTVVRLCDVNPVHLGHSARADGRWRIYIFADAGAPGAASSLAKFSEWLASSSASPLASVPEHLDPSDWLELKLIYQGPVDEIDLRDVPAIFKPRIGPMRLTNYECVFVADSERDIFADRDIDRGGVAVVVRPDQYVSAVFPLAVPDELGAFFAPILAQAQPVA